MLDFYEAEAQVRQLHARYTDAVWRKDLEAFEACFASDAEWRIAGHHLSGRAPIINFICGAFDKYVRILMTFRTPVVSLDEGEIVARTYVSEQNVLCDGNRGYAPIGIYYERFAAEHGTLKFAWRLFETAYVGPPDLSGEFFDLPDYGAPPAMPPRDEPSLARSSILSRT